MTWHKRQRLAPCHVVEFRHPATCDLQDVTKSFSGYQTNFGTGQLNTSVRDNSGSMNHVFNRRGADALYFEYFLDALLDRPAIIPRRGEHLSCQNRPFRPQKHDICKGPANVGSNPKLLCYVLAAHMDSLAFWRQSS